MLRWCRMGWCGYVTWTGHSWILGSPSPGGLWLGCTHQDSSRTGTGCRPGHGTPSGTAGGSSLPPDSPEGAVLQTPCAPCSCKLRQLSQSALPYHSKGGASLSVTHVLIEHSEHRTHFTNPTIGCLTGATALTGCLAYYNHF